MHADPTAVEAVWERVEELIPTEIATTTQNGLMSKEDYARLRDLEERITALENTEILIGITIGSDYRPDGITYYVDTSAVTQYFTVLDLNEYPEKNQVYINVEAVSGGSNYSRRMSLKNGEFFDWGGDEVNLIEDSSSFYYRAGLFGLITEDGRFRIHFVRDGTFGTWAERFLVDVSFQAVD